MLDTSQLNDILADIEQMNFKLLHVNSCKYIKKVVNYYKHILFLRRYKNI